MIFFIFVSISAWSYSPPLRCWNSCIVLDTTRSVGMFERPVVFLCGLAIVSAKTFALIVTRTGSVGSVSGSDGKYPSYIDYTC